MSLPFNKTSPSTNESNKLSNSDIKKIIDECNEMITACYNNIRPLELEIGKQRIIRDAFEEVLYTRQKVGIEF